MKKNVLGIKIDDLNLNQALDIVKGWLVKKDPASPAKRGEKHYIVTPNPEFLVMAQKDKEFKNILNSADLSIPDGVGLRLSGDIVCNTSGIDLMEELISNSQNWGYTVGLLGGGMGVAKEAAECLRKKYPKVTIKYALSGPVIPAKAGIYTNKQSFSANKDLWIPDQVRDDKVDLLFVAFGPPKQEKWIAKNLKNIPVKVAMGVGGALDYISGRVPRAPKILRILGLEWAFRLIVQPWRIKRQLSILKYLWLLLKH